MGITVYADDKSRKKRRRRWGHRLLFSALVVLIALLLDSHFRLVTTEYTVISSRVPEEFRGFRIVQLSDLHGAEFGADNARLISAVHELSPDLIAITGDLAEAHTDMTGVEDLLSALMEIAPVYYVSGNHEWADGRLPEVEAALDDCGAIYLKNEAAFLKRGTEQLVLLGVEDPNGWKDMPKPDALAAELRAETDSFTVLLGHRNYWAVQYPTLPVDVILCGHAHGGIVRLPFLGGVIGTGYVLFPEDTAGMRQVGSYKLIISRGLGSSTLVPRFLNNPEIVCVTLAPD